MNKSGHNSSLEDKMLKDNAIRFFVITSFITNLVVWFLIATKYETLLSVIILQYNVSLGVLKEGEKVSFFVYPTIGLLVIIVNFVLAFYMKKVDILASRLLTAISLFFNLIIVVGVIALIIVNKV